MAFLFFAFLASSAFSWPSKDKAGKVAECPYMQQKYVHEGSGVGHSGLKACPLKDKCPLYAAVVHGEADISFDSLNADGVNWSQAAQSTSPRKPLSQCFFERCMAVELCANTV